MAKLLWKLKNQMDRDKEKEEEAKKSYVCPYCQKQFFCAEDYSRHKRSRQLQNKNPDNKAAIVVDDAENESIVVDLSNALPPGWLRTRKRLGMIQGKSPTHCAPIVDDEQSFSSHDAAINLLALSNNAVPAPETLPPKKRKWSDSSSDATKKLKSKSKMDESHDPKRSCDPDKLKRIGHPCFNKSLKNHFHDHDDENDEGKPMVLVESVDGNDTAYTSLTPHKHVCSVCKRCFSSYQAMGGHKAHHGRKDDDAVPLSSRRHHERPTCREKFSKWQALGGHKRHCNAAARLNEAASHGGSGEVIKKKKRLLHHALCFDVGMQTPTRNGQHKKGGKGMEIKETLSLQWHEDGSEQDTFSYNGSFN